MVTIQFAIVNSVIANSHFTKAINIILLFALQVLFSKPLIILLLSSESILLFFQSKIYPLKRYFAPPEVIAREILYSL